MPSEMSQTNGQEARLLGDERFLRKIAYMYYEEGASQETIADREYCTRQTVSKALQKAKDRGIVRISIVPDMRTGYLHNLSREARIELNLEDIVLVPGRSFEELTEDQIIDEVVIEIAKEAAAYLDQFITDDDVLAVSGGTTFMRNVVRYLKPNRHLPHLQVVSTIGFVEAHTSSGDANLIAYDIAQAYGGAHTWYCVPAFYPVRPGGLEDIAALKSRDMIVKRAVDLLERANIVIMSIWPPQTNDELIVREILTKKQIQAIEDKNPAVDINHWVFDAEGRCINTLLDPPSYYLTGFEIPKLKQKIQQGAKVILVAGGGPAYVPAICAALKAGLANILITDHVTAQKLVQQQ